MQVNFQKNKILKDLCTLGIGGPAAFYCEVHTIEEMQAAIIQCKNLQLRYFVLGKGSNCFFDDEGFQGVILHNKIPFFKQNDNLFHVGAGYSYSLLGTQTAKLGFGGLEFAAGIPASVGGAVFMNAGANNSETCEYLHSVDFIDDEGKFQVIPRSELTFSYRQSPFQKIKGAIVGATFSLHHCPEARKNQIEIVKIRQKTQPYKDKSAGCVFQNPEGSHAGKLIDKCGLKGFHFGDAQVSELHANFLINANQASSKDFLALISHIQTEIERQTGYKLQSEVRFVPAKPFSS